MFVNGLETKTGYVTDAFSSSGSQMKTTLAVLLAAAVLGVASPAAACDCFWKQLTDDTAPPFQPTLVPAIQAQIALRDGRGLSQAGYYNDPSAYVGSGYGERYRAAPRRSGPYVIQSRY
jgi:hypothetical protein